MKVKVSYTIDYDDVPELLETILSSIRQGLGECQQELKFRSDDFDRMVKAFQEARSRLEIIDDQINDILNITAGWLNVESTNQPQLDPSPTAHEKEELDEESN